MGEKKFAVEIRNPDAIRDLYIEVDKILGIFKVPESGISEESQAHTVAHVLHSMINIEDSFRHYTITQCAKMANITLHQERIDTYRSVDFMKWSNMEANYRKLIVAMILDDFRSVLNPKK